MLRTFGERGFRRVLRDGSRRGHAHDDVPGVCEEQAIAAEKGPHARRFRSGELRSDRAQDLLAGRRCRLRSSEPVIERHRDVPDRVFDDTQAGRLDALAQLPPRECPRVRGIAEAFEAVVSCGERRILRRDDVDDADAALAPHTRDISRRAASGLVK